MVLIKGLSAGAPKALSTYPEKIFIVKNLHR